MFVFRVLDKAGIPRFPQSVQYDLDVKGYMKYISPWRTEDQETFSTNTLGWNIQDRQVSESHKYVSRSVTLKAAFKSDEEVKPSHRIIVPYDENTSNDIKLIDYIQSRIPNIKKTTIKQWLEYDMVRMNGFIEKNVHTLIKPGDEVLVFPQTSKKMPFDQTEAKVGYRIIFEDKHLLVADVITWETLLSKLNQKSYQELLLQHLQANLNKNSKTKLKRLLYPIPSSLCHPSKALGIYIFAKSEEVKKIISDNWDKYGHVVVCLCQGSLTVPQGTLSLNVTIGQRNQLTESNYRTLSTHTGVSNHDNLEETYSLIEFSLSTTFKNQILRQLAKANISVVENSPKEASTNEISSTKQMDASLARLMQRIGLSYQIQEISMTHPITGQSLRLTSEINPNFYKLLSEYSKMKVKDIVENDTPELSSESAIDDHKIGAEVGEEKSPTLKVFSSAEYLKLAESKANGNSNSASKDRYPKSKTRSPSRKS